MPARGGQGEAGDRAVRIGACLVSMGLGAGFAMMAWFFVTGYPREDLRWLPVAGAGFLASGIATGIACLLGRWKAAMLLAAAGGVSCPLPGVPAMIAVAPHVSQRDSVEALRSAGWRPGEPIVAFEATAFGAAFYAGQTARVMTDPGELRFGRDRAAPGEDPFLDSARDLRALARRQRVWLLTRSSRLGRLRDATRGLRLRVVWNSGLRLVALVEAGSAEEGAASVAEPPGATPHGTAGGGPAPGGPRGAPAGDAPRGP